MLAAPLLGSGQNYFLSILHPRTLHSGSMDLKKLMQKPFVAVDDMSNEFSQEAVRHSSLARALRLAPARN